MLGPLQGSAILQNQILGLCKGLQSVRIRFWAFARVCNPSESDSGPLQGSAILQNQILGPSQRSAKRQNWILGHRNGLQSVRIRFWGHCKGLQSFRIRFWAVATVCNPPKSDSGPLHRSAIRQNRILKGLPSMNHPVNPLLSSLFIVQFVSLPSLEMGIAGRRARLHLCRAKKSKQPFIYNEKNCYASLLHDLLCHGHLCH